jgi:sugar/nucleoside kinase (ribokinase family)
VGAGDGAVAAFIVAVVAGDAAEDALFDDGDLVLV